MRSTDLRPAPASTVLHHKGINAVLNAWPLLVLPLRLGLHDSGVAVFGRQCWCPQDIRRTTRTDLIEAFAILQCAHSVDVFWSESSRSYIVIVEAFTIPHNYCHCRCLHHPTLSLSRPSRSHILSLSRPSRSYIVVVEAFRIPHIVIVEAFTILHCHCRGLHDPTYLLSLSRPSRSYIVTVEAFTIPHIVIVEAFSSLHCHCRGLHDPTYCHCRGLQ